MNKLEKRTKNKSVIDVLSTAYVVDRNKVQQYIYSIIDKGDENVKLGEVNEKWGGRTIQLGQRHDSHNNGLPTLDKLMYKPGGGKIWRKMSMKSFIKTYPTGTYIIKLDDELILVQDGKAIVGDFIDRSRVNVAFEFTKL